MKTVKRIISIIFALIILTGIFALAPSVFAHAYDTGDIITFGMYPQSEVSDYSLKSSLESQSKNWISYRYYSGTGDELDGKMTPGDYMRYCDVDYGGKKYRGVIFDSYRPKRTGFLTTTENSSQDENGYYANNTYWFEYEPIEWRVLDASQNLIMSEMLLNSIAFNDYVYYVEGTEITYGDSSHTFYCNNYVKSSIRTWLNNSFFDLAFDSSEKSRITTTSLDNGNDGAADDRIFLLSYSDSMNTAYGFSASSDVDRSRMAEGTDYAKCQGLWVDEESGYSYWRLRTQGQKSFFTCDIKYDGSVHDDYRPFATGCGVRPVMRLSDLNLVSATQTNRDNAGDTNVTDNYDPYTAPEVGNDLTNGKDYKTGDIVEFGSYPQSDVTSSLGSVLNSQSGTWKSYGYYSGTGNDSDGQMTASDYMRYKDVAYNGNKYRGVTFYSYRPYCTGYTSGDNYQQSNGYTTGNVYWFKYEPLKWRVLDPSTGLVMCETIIDSQPCNNYIVSNGSDSHGNTAYWGDSSQTYYANNYAKSSIREWINDDFYNTAFSAEQKANINTTTLNNDGYYTLTGTTGYEDYDSSSTNDKIFLLSYDEVLNSSYGFSTSAGEDYDRRAKGSDYAKCQGLYVYNSSGSSYDGCSPWRLRSFGSNSGDTCNVNYDGNVSSGCDTISTDIGVRPALKLLNLKSGSEILFQSEMLPYTLVAAGIILAATIAAIILILRMRKSYFKTGINNSAPQRKQRVKKTPSTRKPQTSPDPQARRQPQAQRQCPYCGGPLSPGAQFCKNCGNRVQ